MSNYKSAVDFTWYRGVSPKNAAKTVAKLNEAKLNEAKESNLTVAEYQHYVKDFLDYCKDKLVSSDLGVVLPEGLGDLKVLGIVPRYKVQLTTAPGKPVLQNYHTDGYVYKFYYFWRYYKDNRVMTAASYRTTGSWRFVPSKKAKLALYNKIVNENQIPFPKISSVKEVNPYSSPVNPLSRKWVNK